MKISIRMPMGICEHDSLCLVNLSMKHVFLPHRLVCFGSLVLFFAFGLSLDQVVGYSDWSHTFWSCNLGRNGSDCLCDGIFVTFT